MFDYSKLRGRIVEKFGSLSAFAESIGSTVQRVSAKLHDRIGITRSDIIIWCKALEIDLSEIGVYFFALKV